jgi:hypothetical protein
MDPYETRITNIIEQLKNIHLQEASLLAELDSVRKEQLQSLKAAARSSAASSGRAAAAPTTTNTSPQRRKSPTTKRRPFEEGDRVCITNTVTPRYPNSSGAVSIRDREGTVIRVTAKRVTVRTDNGSDVSRAPTNLRRL